MVNQSGLLTTTERSMQVVETVQELDGARASRLSDELDLAVSTTHKHLQTLTSLGLLRRQGDHYHVGFRFLNLGASSQHSLDVSADIRNCIQDLAQRTGEEVDFFVESNGRAITLFEAYDSTNPYQSEFVDSADNHWRVGTYYKMHSIAPGKAILSRFPKDRVTQLVDQWGLPPVGPNTITSEPALHDELDRIASQRYATSDEEYAKGLCGIAMALELEDGLFGSVAISTPSYRFNQSGFVDDLKQELSESVSELESKLDE